LDAQSFLKYEHSVKLTEDYPAPG